MIGRKICSWNLLVLFCVCSINAQEIQIDSVNTSVDSLEVVSQDTIISKQDLVDYAQQIDSVWIETMYSSPLYDAIPLAIEDSISSGNQTEYLFTTDLLKERLQLLNEKTPFNLEYNPVLERMIKSYLKTRKKYYPKMFSRAMYYFPMFEKYLDQYDIPLEIKYLAIVESALNPRAKSRVGATGIWQFMYQTGKQFGLKVSSYVDERQDPVKSAIAACKYLSSLYKTFNDWDLALAAYNSGPGNVSKAIRRSGGYRNYWNIRPYLPRETAGYLPAFYSTLYIFEYAKEHKIFPEEPVIRHFATDTIRLKRLLTFDQLNETLGVSIELLQFLNPQYKLDIVPHVKGRDYALRLPQENVGTFLENEKEIYLLADEEDAKREKPLPKYFEMNQRIRYKVRSGDYLGRIANRYGVRVSDIKKWNGMRTTNLSVGQRLTIYPKRLNFTAAKVSTKKKASKIPKGKRIEYTIQKGDSLWSISKKYPKITIQQIKEWNGIWNAKNLVPGKKIYLYKTS